MAAEIIVRKDGVQVVIRDEYLDDDFCDRANDYFRVKHNFVNDRLSSYFSAEAIKEYIIDNNLNPIYEEE